MSFFEHLEHNEHMNHLLKNKKDLEHRTNECHLSDDSSDEDIEHITMNINKFIKQKLKSTNELERRKRPKKKKKGYKEESSKEEAKWALTVFD
ncbi:unnamed protein product, partial [Musa textilis]